MTITISCEDPRSIKAIEIAAGAGQWFRCQTANGKRYGIPSSRDANHYYLVDQHNCTCQDAARNSGQPCKHQLAVRLHVELLKAGAVPRPASDVVDGLAQMVVDRHPVLDMIREEDGSIRWERHDHSNGTTSYLPRHDHPRPVADASTYVRIFGKEA